MINRERRERLKKIWGYLRDYLRHNFRWRLYLLLAALLAAAFWHNYANDYKRELFAGVSGRPVETLVYLLYYLIPYYGAALLVAWLSPERAFLARRGFWAVSFLMLTVLALNRTALGALPRLLAPLDLNRFANYYLHMCLINVVRLVTILVPLWIFRRIWDRERPTFYGLTRLGFRAGPYLVILLLVAPLIAWASFQSAFQRTYPIYEPGVVERALGWSPWLTYPLHDAAYAMRFIGVELFFRGFLILGMMRWMGQAALLPMVALYAVWHFAKPFPEALASVFGAWVLGVIAIYSRNIVGGVLVHVGVALLMNLAALLQKLAR